MIIYLLCFRSERQENHLAEDVLFEMFKNEETNDLLVGKFLAVNMIICIQREVRYIFLWAFTGGNDIFLQSNTYDSSTTYKLVNK